MITLIQLKYIIAVEKYGSFVKASEYCHVTQPTLSMQIKKAEEELGVSIFDRNTNPVIPTKIGRKIIVQGRMIMDEYNYLESLIQQEKKEITGDLIIGVIPTISAFFIPNLMEITEKNFPDLKVVFMELKTDEIVDALQRNFIEIGIMAGPYENESLSVHKLFREPIFPYVNDKSVKGKFVEVEHLKNITPWLLTEGNCFRTQMINLCGVNKEGGFSDSVKNLNWKYEGGSIETLVRLVNQFGGYTLVPGLASEHIQLEDEYIKVFKGIDPVREVIACTRKRFSKLFLLEQLIEKIREDLPVAYTGDRGDVLEWK